MELIDEGGFGCVFRPPMNCKRGPPTDITMVSKLQPTKYGKYEMKQIQKLKRICKKYIPNCGKYFIVDVKMCEPRITEQTRKNSQCHLLGNVQLTTETRITNVKNRSSRKIIRHKNPNKKLNILNMPYMGVNLHKYILKNIDFKQPDTFTKLNNAIIDLYQNGILILNKNNFYHNDIKTANIIVDETGNLRLIDWGLSNNIVFIYKFIFNKPYMYILLTDYFLEKLVKLKKENKVITKELVEPILNTYIQLTKIKTSDDYFYTKEILEFMFPHFTDDSFNNPTSENIHPILYEHFVNLCLRFESIEKWTDTYIQNLDIVSLAIMYPDILCAIGMQKVTNIKLQQGIIDFYTKYVLGCYEPIKPDEFIADLNNLNMLLL